MFQLIVAVISIALVAALAIASIYYGGDAFQKSSLRANVVTLVNGGQQIAGAAALYKTDKGGVNPTSMGDLGTEYLSQTPGLSPIADNTAAEGWKVTGTYATVKLNVADTATVCAEVNRQATGDKALNGTQFFCSATAGGASAVDGGFFNFKL